MGSKTTRCKFRCIDVIDHGKRSYDGRVEKTINLIPVFSQDPNHENKAFWDSSPSGHLTLAWVNDAVGFEPGKEYYIDISEA